jgi:hypothetical protein
METVEVLMQMPKVEGHEYTGEYRQVQIGEISVYNPDGTPRVWPFPSTGEYPILRKVEIWKPLTLEKAVEFMVNRTDVTMRYVNCQPGKTEKQKITNIYMHVGIQPSIDLGGRGATAHLRNIQYLEQ